MTKHKRSDPNLDEGRGVIPLPMAPLGDFDAALAKATFQPVVRAARTPCRAGAWKVSRKISSSRTGCTRPRALVRQGYEAIIAASKSIHVDEEDELAGFAAFDRESADMEAGAAAVAEFRRGHARAWVL
jgi:hypothetical protein